MEGTRKSLWDEVKRIDLVDYLDTLGIRPQKIRNSDYWYLSPLRQEKTPSFKTIEIKMYGLITERVKEEQSLTLEQSYFNVLTMSSLKS